MFLLYSLYIEKVSKTTSRVVNAKAALKIRTKKLGEFISSVDKRQNGTTESLAELNGLVNKEVVSSFIFVHQRTEPSLLDEVPTTSIAVTLSNQTLVR